MSEATGAAKKRTTLYLPTWLHRAIKTEAAQTDRDMTEIIVELLMPRYTEQNSPFFSPEMKAQLIGNMSASPNKPEVSTQQEAAPLNQSETA